MPTVFSWDAHRKNEIAEGRDDPGPVPPKDYVPGVAPKAAAPAAQGSMSQADFAYGKQTDEQKAKSAKKLADLLRARGD